MAETELRLNHREGSAARAGAVVSTVSDRRPPPRARDRILGARLRAARLRYSTLTLEQLAELSGISLATLSRTENGRRRITSEDAATLLAFCRVPHHVRVPMVESARSDSQDSVWQTAAGADLDGVCSLDAAADTIVEWSITTIPPLLQTPAYTAARLQAAGTPADEIAHHVRAQTGRQQVLDRVDYTAFVHEAALHPRHGSTAVVAEQLGHLAGAISRGVGVRVIRQGTPLHTLPPHPWLLWHFPKDPPIVHLRLQRVNLYLQEPESTAYRHLATHLTQTACSSHDTRRMLADLANHAPTRPSATVK